jgi:LDH2 family malate/lactate/ureidoglycolate dehydrogenase
MTTVPVERLRAFIEALFRAAGYEEHDVQTGTDAFLLQEMRGIQTHALRRLRAMIDDGKAGKYNLKPNRRVVIENGGAYVYDGDSGLGITSCMDAMDLAIEGAKAHGLGYCGVVNSNHFLAAAPYCVRAAEAGAIGLAYAGGGASMAYPGTKVGTLGNSPVGFGAPTAAGFSIIFDSALTMSGGRLIQWAKQGKKVPDGFFGYDAQGNYTDDPGAIYPGGVPLPIGMHKGAGLAILVDILSCVINGASFLRTLAPADHPEWKRDSSSHGFIAIDIEHLMPLDDFKERMAAYVADVKSKPLAEGYDEIFLPGERAARQIEACKRNGVTLEADVVPRMIDLADRYGVPLPFERATA